MALPIYINNNLYEIKEYNLENIFNKKLLILNYQFDINQLLLKINSINKNIKGIVVSSIDVCFINNELKNFEKFNYMGNLTKVLEFVLENYNDSNSVFVLRAPTKQKFLVEFMKKYLGTFIYIDHDCFFYKFTEDENYKIFDLILINDFACLSKQNFFKYFKDSIKNGLFKDILSIKIHELFSMFGEFTFLIFDTKMENLWFYLNEVFTKKKYIFDKNKSNTLIENIKKPPKKEIMYNFTKKEYLDMGLSLLKKDFLRFSSLHSWYKHIPLKGTTYYFYLNKGEQIRNILENNVEDSEEIHWHFTSIKPEEKKHGSVLLGPFLTGDVHGFNIIRTGAGNQIFEEWKKINNLSKKAEALGTLTAVMNGEKPYFHIEWLMDNVFKLTPEEKAENQKYWAKDAAGAAAGPEGAAGATGTAGTQPGGGGGAATGTSGAGGAGRVIITVFPA